MDFDLKQWRNQHQSEQLPSAKIPRLLLETLPGSGSGSSSGSDSGFGSTLPLFVPEPNARMISSMSVFSESSTATPSVIPRTGGVFSLAQRQELELQALIFKYILAGAAVPVELLQPFKILLNTSPSYLYHPYQSYQHYQPHVLQFGYWGRNVVDPEPGRCRRTDGKKWRCSRNVVPGQKYCERHVHRGRNRSRKPVEIPTPAAAGLQSADSMAALPLKMVADGVNCAHSKQSPSIIDLIQLNQRSTESKMGKEFTMETQNIEGNRSEGQLLRHFFDEWPKSREDSNGTVCHNASPTISNTGLSIAIPRNHTSDFSLKLSTGNVDGPPSGEGPLRADRSHQTWGREWATQQGSSMGGGGGLLAEMLRSSISNSPTSVLHELRRGCVSETSSIST